MRHYGWGVAVGAAMLVGAGSPNNVVRAGAGSTWQRTDGGAGTSYYIKESSGAASSGWRAP